MAWQQDEFLRSLTAASANTVAAYRRDVAAFCDWAERSGAAGPDAVDKGIAEHHWVLRRDKARIASYRALKVLYKRKRQPSKALACAYELIRQRSG